MRKNWNISFFPPSPSAKEVRYEQRKICLSKKHESHSSVPPVWEMGVCGYFWIFLSILRPTHRCIFFPFFRKSIRETGERSNLLPTISSHVHVGLREKNRKINTMHRFPPIFSRVGVSHDLCCLFDLGFSMSVYSGNRLSDSVFFPKKKLPTNWWWFLSSRLNSRQNRQHANISYIHNTSRIPTKRGEIRKREIHFFCAK